MNPTINKPSHEDPAKDLYKKYGPEAFRDSIGTVKEDGKRNWIYPKKPKGSYYQARIWVSSVFLALLSIGPFLRWDGHPMFLINVFERKFILFGVIFWPQDFHLFVLAMIAFFVFIVLFTVIFGRVFCGWVCPQTVFMEMVFRRIEYWIEGDANQQKKLNKAPWTTGKILKKVAKLSLFGLVSFLIGNLVMAYMVGTEEHSKLITEGPFGHSGKFSGVLIFSGIFFFVFSYFREQACLVICPYGRLQGVLLSKDSIVVAYDWIRGEPRGRINKKEKVRTKGSCIDCKLCVQVCPTGIDIRNGTQMECVNCTACIDACNMVMDRVGFERGLIRYDSHHGIANQQKFKITPRIIAYSLVLVGLLTVLGFSLGSRSDVEATILRTPGMLYQETATGDISNLYNIQIVNKTNTSLKVDIQMVSHTGTIKLISDSLHVPASGIGKGAMFIEIPKEELDGMKNKIKLEIYHGEELLEIVKTNFLGPLN
ncbi:MAG: cytochrome c oxidase accessory protein CcoG [Bacteroidota bacterium]